MLRGHIIGLSVHLFDMSSTIYNTRRDTVRTHRCPVGLFVLSFPFSWILFISLKFIPPAQFWVSFHFISFHSLSFLSFFFPFSHFLSFSFSFISSFFPRLLHSFIQPGSNESWVCRRLSNGKRRQWPRLPEIPTPSSTSCVLPAPTSGIPRGRETDAGNTTPIDATKWRRLEFPTP